MPDITATIIRREKNQIEFELFDAITITATSNGRREFKENHHEITIRAIDNETGDYAVIPINGIDYKLYYATGRITDGGNFVQATHADIRRSESGYFGTPPTDNARQAVYALVRSLLEQIGDDDNVQEFLDAGQQVKLQQKVARVQTEIDNLKDEYALRVRELYDSIDESGNLNGFDLSFPHPQWVTS